MLPVSESLGKPHRLSLSTALLCSGSWAVCISSPHFLLECICFLAYYLFTKKQESWEVGVWYTPFLAISISPGYLLGSFRVFHMLVLCPLAADVSDPTWTLASLLYL